MTQHRFEIQRLTPAGRWLVAAVAPTLKLAQLMAHIASVDQSLPVRIVPVRS